MNLFKAIGVEVILRKEGGQKGGQEKLFNWHREMVSAGLFAKPGFFIEHEVKVVKSEPGKNMNCSGVFVQPAKSYPCFCH